MSKVHERLGRTVKAERIAMFLKGYMHRFDIGIETVRNFDASQWIIAATGARCHPPSKQTQAEVIQLLESDGLEPKPAIEPKLKRTA